VSSLAKLSREPLVLAPSTQGQALAAQEDYAGIGERDIELALLFSNLPEKTIKVGKVRYVSLHSADISSYFLDCCSQLWLSAPRDEDVRGFVHKPLRRGKAVPLVPPVISAIFPLSLCMGFLLTCLDWPKSLYCPVTSTMRNRALPCIMRA
jgi:hypothetical protein